ncbi:M56 family metallopeptidase [Christiangramia fulva]|nr:M56 family metallopeptidase [Christiangramia fulva]
MLILFGFYRFLLEDENMPVFKRFYLLATVIISLILPFVTITYTIEAAPETANTLLFPVDNSVTSAAIPSATNWHKIAGFTGFGIYLCGVLFFSFRFIRNLFTISREISENEKKSEFPYIFVLLRRNLIPHSFLRYIFLGKSDFENNNISHAVLEHEKAHVDQKHSWDLLLIELLQVIFWFNPVFFELKKSIRLNHEFLADRKVLAGAVNPVEYSQLLFSYTSATHHNSLYSPFNNSLIKKRILMISKNFSSRRFLTRLGFLIPVLALCIFLFNNDIVAKPVHSNENSTDLPLNLFQQPSKIHIMIEGESISLNGKEIKLKNFGKELDKITNGLSAEEISEIDFNVQTRDTKDGLIDKLEEEFQNTRFAKITGMTLLPPPPPPAPKIGDMPPPPPPASAHEHMPPPPPPPAEHGGEVPPAPPAPAHPQHPPMPPARHDSLRKMAMKEQRMAEREQERMRDLEERYADNPELLEEKKQEFKERIQERRQEIQERMAEMQRHRQQMMEERQAMMRERQRMIQEHRREILEKRDSIRNNNYSDQ